MRKLRGPAFIEIVTGFAGGPYRGRRHRYRYPLALEYPLCSFPNVMLTPYVCRFDLESHLSQASVGYPLKKYRPVSERRQMLNELSHQQLQGL
jgi:hypothetical protein